MTDLLRRFTYAEELAGKRFTFYGPFSRWPRLFGVEGPEEHVRGRGARAKKRVDDELDYLVIGEGREKGKAQAVRDAEKLRLKGAAIETLDESAFLHLIRPSVSGCSFAFAGGFSQAEVESDHGIAGLLRRHGAIVHDAMGEGVELLVVGDSRQKGKAAAVRKASELEEAGADIVVLTEANLLDLVSCLEDPASEKLDFRSFAVQLHHLVDPRKLERAIKMLKRDRMELYTMLDEGKQLGGIVRSQRARDTYYACWIEESGAHGCTDHGLGHCYGQGDSMCKHLLVLLIGTTRAGALDAAVALRWARAGAKKRPSRPERGPQHSAELLVRFNSERAGEIDWRPTETVPEDYYLL